MKNATEMFSLNKFQLILIAKHTSLTENVQIAHFLSFCCCG